jgi:ABC-type multidrug transport system ATPase subunit
MFYFALTNSTIDMISAPFTSLAVNFSNVGLTDVTITDFHPFSQVIVDQSLNTSGPPRNVTVTSSQVWIAAATVDNTTARSKVWAIRFPQFSDFMPGGGGSGGSPPSLPSLYNPAGVPASAQPCAPSYWWSGSQCLPLPSTIMWSHPSDVVRDVEVRWRGMPSTDNGNNAPTDCDPFNITCLQQQLGIGGLPSDVPALGGIPSPDASASLYGNRFMVFASSAVTALLHVFSLVPENRGCNEATALLNNNTATTNNFNNTLLLLPSRENDLPLMGTLTSMSVTPNGQFVLGSIQRQRYEVAAMERITLICERLAADPSDVFLAAYSDACNSREFVPRNPDTIDFIQIASACIPGVQCPSFTEEVVEPIPSGQYTTFGFDIAPCPAGSFCVGGRSQPCPIGFTCPHRGMTLPLVCPTDASRATTCFPGGLTEPLACPNGTLCSAPYLPPMPAPPGFSQSVMIIAIGNASVANTTRDLQACLPGQWCGLGRANSEGNATMCPAGTFCSAPDVVTPTICTLGGRCNTTACPQMPLCLNGSVAENLCPAGFYCPSNSERVECSPGTYCPEGSVLWTQCLAGSYCPTPAQQLACPEGAYCPESSTLPVPCGPLTQCVCVGGCSAPPFTPVLAAIGVVALLALLAGLLWYFVLRYAWHAWRSRKAAEGIQRRRRAADSGVWTVNEAGELTAAATASSAGSSKATATIYDVSDLKPVGGARKKSSTAQHNRRPRSCLPRFDHLLSRRQFIARWPASANGGADANGGSATSDDQHSLATGITSLSPLHSLGQLGHKRFSLEVSCSNLSMKLRSNGTTIISNISATLRPGRVFAVMGPSGSGKTSWLAALTGKAASFGRVTGEIRINGHVGTLTDPKYKCHIGFVPQEDVMMRTLTVSENITFSALTRLPATWSRDRKLHFADSIVELLGLSHLRDAVIGDETRRGISGGQRKRVNIGIELAGKRIYIAAQLYVKHFPAANPLLLFLDEPTTGLDAQASLEVAKVLRKIAGTLQLSSCLFITSKWWGDGTADLGITVALVMHQPRFEILSAFDDLLLLANGGSAAYCGPVSDVFTYMERSFGLACPPRTNPADFLLDVVSGKSEARASRDFSQLSPRSDSSPSSAETKADDDESSMVVEVTPASIVAAWATEHKKVGKATSPKLSSADPPLDRKSVTFGELVMLFVQRSLSQQLRAPIIFILNNVLLCVAALFLAAVYFGSQPYAIPQPLQAFTGCPSAVREPCQTCLAAVQDQLLNRAIMTIIAISLVGVATFIHVFLSERVVYWREAASLPQPVHTLAYAIGKDIAMLPQLVFGPLVFCLAYNLLATPRASFGEYYVLFVGVYWTASAYAYLTSVLAPPSLAQLLGIVAIFCTAQFAGAQPTLTDMRTKFIPLNYLPDISYMRYALEQQYVMEVKHYADVVLVQGLELANMVRSNFGFDLSSQWKDAGIVFAFGFALRIFAVIAMVLIDRDKKI